MRSPLPSKSRCALFGTMLLCSVTFLLLSAMGDAQAPKAPPAPTDAQKKAAAQAQKAAMDALRQQETEGLKTAYILLALANNNYGPHKGNAMREVETALKLLDGNAMKPLHERIRAMQRVNGLVAGKLYAVGLAPDANELQAISDSQVGNAGGMLSYLANVMAVNKQGKLQEHVQNAVKAIQAAPKHEGAGMKTKGREAHILTSAYILLASANHDYDGYRAKAMNRIVRATNQLDAEVLKHGSVQQRIKALQDGNAELVARINANQEPTISEPQVMSDAQLMLADALIQRVAPYVQSPQQKSVLTLLRDAHTEIGIALSRR